MRALGQKLVKFCAHTRTRGKISSRDTLLDGLNYVFLDYFNTGNTLRCFV